MSINLDELQKIKRATSGMFKKSARVAVRNALDDAALDIEETNKIIDEKERRTQLVELNNRYTQKRQLAVSAGARSHGHREWAAAAACESWTQALLLDDQETILAVETMVQSMREVA